jgi:hypothetical protein
MRRPHEAHEGIYRALAYPVIKVHCQRLEHVERLRDERQKVASRAREDVRDRADRDFLLDGDRRVYGELAVVAFGVDEVVVVVSAFIVLGRETVRCPSTGVLKLKCPRKKEKKINTYK